MNAFRTGPNPGMIFAIVIVCVFAPAFVRKVKKSVQEARNAREQVVVAPSPDLPGSPDGFRIRGLTHVDAPMPPELPAPPPYPAHPGHPGDAAALSGEISRQALDSAEALSGNPEEAKRIGRAVESVVASLVRNGYLRISTDAKHLASAAGLLEAAARIQGSFDGPSADDPVEPRATVLVVSDLTSASEEVRKRLSTGASALRRDGVRLLGAAPGNKAQGEELERQRDLASQARKALGLVSTDSPEAASLLAPWINQADGVDAVLWIVPDPRDPTRADVRVFGPSSQDEGESGSIVRSLHGVFRATPR
jgi:hypothetical protein